MPRTRRVCDGGWRSAELETVPAATHFRTVWRRLVFCASPPSLATLGHRGPGFDPQHRGFVITNFSRRADCTRKAESKATAGAVAACVDCSPVQLENALRDREAEAGAARVARPFAGTGAVEAVEDERQIGRPDADAGVD